MGDIGAPDGAALAGGHDVEGEASSDEEVAAVEGWMARPNDLSIVHAISGEGCIHATLSTFPPDQEVAVAAANEHWVLLAGDGDFARRADVELLGSPADLDESPPAGIIALDTPTLTLDAAGCLMEIGEAKLFDEIEGVASWHDEGYHGFAVVDRDLTLVSIRHVDVDTWTWPWSSSLQLVKEIPGEGFVIGGGVLVGPGALLTAAHLGVDESFCYGWGPAAGPAWDNGEFVCGNIAGPGEAHPGGVDVAIVSLLEPEPPPYAHLRLTPLAGGEALYSSRLGELLNYLFVDGEVDAVTSENAYCDPWPEGSSFLTAPIVGPGDSGGPAWVGTDLVGLVHGERCKPFLVPGPDQHVFVHLPGIYSFVEPVLAPLALRGASGDR